MAEPDRIYIDVVAVQRQYDVTLETTKPDDGFLYTEYIHKDALLEWVKFAYGKVSMNPFDCSEAFEELIDKINSL